MRCQSDLFNDKPIVIGANDHRFLIAEDLSQLNIQADIILEPVQRNSCAAIIAGCLQAIERDENSIVLVLAADHAIKNENGFRDTIQRSMSAANEGHLITFGIKPDYPATGYGYVLPDTDNLIKGGYLVSRFVEKPNETLAKQYMNEGCFWNSGNFMFRASVFLDEAKRLVPQIVGAATKSHLQKKSDLDFLRLDEKAFSTSPSISVDYAIMEKTEKAVVFPASHDWSDIGTWNSVWRNLPKDEADNAFLGDIIIKDDRNNFVHSRERLTTLLGVDDTIVVVTRDAILVGNQSQSEQIKRLVDELNLAE